VFSRVGHCYFFTIITKFLCFVDHASLYNLVNKANLVHNLFLAYLFLVYLSSSTCFGQLYIHHQEKQLEFHSTLHTRQSSTQNNKYQVSHKHSCFSWRWTHSCPKHVEIHKYTKSKYTKNKLCTKLALFTRLSQTLALLDTISFLIQKSSYIVSLATKPIAGRMTNSYEGVC